MESRAACKPVKLHSQLYTPNFCDKTLPPIVLLHGAGATHSSFNKVRIKIADETKRQVYALDLRNHGQSEWNEVFSLDAQAADVENFLAQNGIKKCIFLGHSLGGRTAQYITLQKPEIVDKVIIEEVALSNPPAHEIKPAVSLISSLKSVRLLPKGLTEKEVRTFLSNIAAEKYPDEPAVDIAFYLPLRRGYDGKFQCDFNIDVLEKTFRDRSAFDIDFSKCQKFSGPALVVYSETSRVKVGEDKRIKEYFPNAEFCKFKNAGHVLHLEKPEEYIEKVSNFINR